MSSLKFFKFHGDDVEDLQDSFNDSETVTQDRLDELAKALNSSSDMRARTAADADAATQYQSERKEELDSGVVAMSWGRKELTELLGTSTSPNRPFNSKWDLKIRKGRRLETDDDGDSKMEDTLVYEAVGALELMSKNGGYSRHVLQAIRSAVEMMLSLNRCFGFAVLVQGTQWYQVVMTFVRGGQILARLSPKIELDSHHLDAASAILSLMEAPLRSLGVFDERYYFQDEHQDYHFVLDGCMNVGGQSVVFEARSRGVPYALQFVTKQEKFDEMVTLVSHLRGVDDELKKHFVLPLGHDPESRCFWYPFFEFGADVVDSDQWFILASVIFEMHRQCIFHLDMTPANLHSQGTNLRLGDWGSCTIRPGHPVPTDQIYSTRPFYPSVFLDKLALSEEDMVIIDQTMFLRSLQYCMTPMDMRGDLLHDETFVMKTKKYTEAEFHDMMNALLFSMFRSDIAEDEFREKILEGGKPAVCVCAFRDQYNTNGAEAYFPCWVDTVDKEERTADIRWKSFESGSVVSVDDLYPYRRGWRKYEYLGLLKEIETVDEGGSEESFPENVEDETVDANYDPELSDG